jgi:lincosamide nucleotidyltransferase A/C/D/E
MKEMRATDVVELVTLLEANGIDVWVDGGWGVDALLGRQTRPHGDLDIAVRHEDVPRLRKLLAGKGYREVPKPDAKEWNFVLGDGKGREVDVHSFTLAPNGEPVYGIPYPPGSLTGTGIVNGCSVRCISPEHLVRFRAGYSPRATDVHDVLALCRRFNLLVPGAYQTAAKEVGRGKGLVDAIRRSRPVGRRTTIVAIDGYGGSGKTTLANGLAAGLGNTTVVRTDDFSRPGVSGWDWQRMKAQVLDPIANDQPGRYQRYDWPTHKLAEWREVPVGGTLIIEGVSSMRRELGRYWDFAIWVPCPHDVRLARGVVRDGEGKRSQWEKVWIPEEDEYVRTQTPEGRADVTVDGEVPFEL